MPSCPAEFRTVLSSAELGQEKKRQGWQMLLPLYSGLYMRLLRLVLDFASSDPSSPLGRLELNIKWSLTPRRPPSCSVSALDSVWVPMCQCWIDLGCQFYHQSQVKIPFPRTQLLRLPYEETEGNLSKLDSWSVSRLVFLSLIIIVVVIIHFPIQDRNAR